MTPGPISRRIAADRLATVTACLSEIRGLPLSDRDAFFRDRRNVWTAESCLRRALEAVFDLGRHLLAKGSGILASFMADRIAASERPRTGRATP